MKSPAFWAIQFLSIPQPSCSIFSGVSWFMVDCGGSFFKPPFFAGRTWFDDMDGHDMVRQWKTKEHLEISLNFPKPPTIPSFQLLKASTSPRHALTNLSSKRIKSFLLLPFFWSQNFTKKPFFLQLLNWRGLFVDETVCAGCLKCASTAPGTFEVDPRTRQFGAG